MTTEQCINQKVYKILELLKSGAAAGLIKEARVVDTLPTASKDTMRILYLVSSSDPQASDEKEEYFTVESNGEYTWEKFGVPVDLSGYASIEGAQHLCVLTQSEYDNITTKDPNTLYFIKETQ